MFIGHFGVAFAAKRFSNRVPLWLLFVAVQFVDVLWGIFVWLGIEKVAIAPGILPANQLDFVSYPYTHSLIASLSWGIAVFLLFRFWFFRTYPDPFCAARAMGVAVVSHYFLDLLVHRPDLPLWFGDSPKIGLGIWGNVPLTLITEIGFLFAGFWLYMSGTRAKTKAGNWGWWLFVLLLTLMWAFSIFGPPPPSIVGAVVVPGMILFIVIFLVAAWLEKKRVPKAA